MDPPLNVALAFAEDPGGPPVPTTALRIYSYRAPGVTADDSEDVAERLVLCQGLQDGSVVLYHLPEELARPARGQTASPIKELSADRHPVSGIALTTLRSPVLGSPRSDLTPNLSRKSSSTNLGSWNHSDEGFALGPRPRGVSSASTTRTAASATSFELPGESRPPPVGAVNKTSATASLSKVKAADDAEMLEHLRAQRASTPTQAEHPGVVTKLAAAGRRGIDSDRARSPHADQRARAVSSDRNGSASRSSKSKLERMLSVDYHAADSMVEQIEEEEEEAAHVNSLMPPTSPPGPPTAASPANQAAHSLSGLMQCPTLRVLLPGMHKIPVVSICQVPGTSKIAVLGETGLCSIVDMEDGTAGGQIDCLQQHAVVQKRLRMPVDFVNVEVLRQEDDPRLYLLASGHLPRAVAKSWAEPTSFGAVLTLDTISGTVGLLDTFSLPAIGAMTLDASATTHTDVWHCQDDKRVVRYELSTKPTVTPPKAPAPLKPSHAAFKMPDFLSGTRSAPETAAVSRVPSRAESVKHAAKGDHAKSKAEEPASLARAIRDRLKGRDCASNAAPSHSSLVSIGDEQHVIDLESRIWTDIKVSGGQGIVWNRDGHSVFVSQSPDQPRARLVRHDATVGNLGQLTRHIQAPQIDTERTDQLLPRVVQTPTADHQVILVECSGKDAVVRLENHARGLAIVSSQNTAGQTMTIARGQHLDLLNLAELGRPLGPVDAPEDTAKVTCLAEGLVGESKRVYKAVGRDDGSLELYDSDMVRCAEYALFAEAVQRILPVPIAAPKVCRGCVIVADEAGTVAIVDLDKVSIRHVIPGGRSPLNQIFVGPETIVLTYKNGKARAWDLGTLEFRRSTGLESAEEMLAEGFFVEINDSAVRSAKEQQGVSVPIQAALVDLASADLLNHGLADNRARHTLGLLGTVWNFEICDAPYSKAQEQLGLGNRHGCVGVGSGNTPPAAAAINTSDDLDTWRVSAMHTAHQLLVLTTLLVSLPDSDQHEQPSAILSTALAALLPQMVGKGYCDAELSYFIPYYAHPITHIHQAARMLFEARTARLPDTELTLLTDHYAEILTAKQQTKGDLSEDRIRALTLLGAVATCRYAVLSAATLREVSLALLNILENPQGHHHRLAIDFIQRGFELWQTFLDPICCLRALFALATSTDAPASTAAYARAAVLHLAGSHTALFITTLSNDIVDANTVKERTAVMKLCVHVARRKPASLHPNLGRLVEAVVHSLDPTRTTMRESIQQTATVIINELVGVFSTVAFSHATQKLAVGTAEGAVNVYDLKTATRLYVLDANAPEIAAISFSPDGRRLVTASLHGHKLTVWKVGTSFSSIFSIGAPPRQGSERGQPFKVIDFALVEQVPHNTATGLPILAISWPGQRSACLEVGETKMTFAT